LHDCALRLSHGGCDDLAALVNAEASLGNCRAQCYGDGLEFAERAIRLAARSGDEAAMAFSLLAYSACLTFVGDYPEARRALDAVEVPSERPNVLFLQALLEARLEGVTVSEGFLESAGEPDA